MAENERLAELLGNESLIVESLRCNWQPDMDAADMQDVYPVLKERGLWDEFVGVYFACNNGSWYHFLNDLPGQVQAAIKVLGEAKVSAREWE